MCCGKRLRCSARRGLQPSHDRTHWWHFRPPVCVIVRAVGPSFGEFRVEWREVLLSPQFISIGPHRHLEQFRHLSKQSSLPWSQCALGAQRDKDWATWTRWSQKDFQLPQSTRSCCTMFARMNAKRSSTTPWRTSTRWPVISCLQCLLKRPALTLSRSPSWGGDSGQLWALMQMERQELHLLAVPNQGRKKRSNGCRNVVGSIMCCRTAAGNKCATQSWAPSRSKRSPSLTPKPRNSCLALVSNWETA